MHEFWQLAIIHIDCVNSTNHIGAFINQTLRLQQLQYLCGDGFL